MTNDPEDCLHRHEDISKEPLINSLFVIPAYAEIQKIKHIDSGLRRNDELIRGSLNAH
jgi:hypothetical protein